MKTFKIFSTAALAFMMAACSSEDAALNNSPAQQQGRKVQFTATIAAPNSGAGTRTEYTEVTSGDAAGTIDVAWKANDEIALIHNGTKDVVKIETVNEDGSATITGDITVGTDGEKVEVCYPAALWDAEASGAIRNATFVANTTKQDGTLKYIQDNLDVRMGESTLKLTGDKATLSANVTLASQLAIWKLNLQDNATPTPAALQATKVTMKVDGTPEPVAIAGTTTLGTATSTIYLGLDKFTNEKVIIEATVGSDTYKYEKEGVSLALGKYYQSTVKMTKPVDLSMVDNAGNAREKQWTANCYMVHTAGDYKLPLVYGNAIKDGAANTAAYTGITDANTTLTFPNHAGNAINAPWITKATTGTGADKGMGITVSTAELLWQDAEGLITKVGIIGDYLTLTVGKNASEQEGNALIAAKTSDGTIVWSWHIWVTKETFADATLTTVATGSHDYKVTPVNLGWVPTGGDGKQGYNTYYQWGRKDAFIPGTWNAATNRTVYDISNTAVTGLTYEGSSTTATIADNIKNPMTFYNYNTTFCNMWDAQQTGTDNITTATKKTVYDPCPAGFCVPTGNLYCFMGNNGNRTMTTWDNTNKGATWDNNVVANSISGNALFFPASGHRTISDGTFSDFGAGGYCWSASPGSGGNRRSLDLHSGKWDWADNNRANGFPVRAVAEE